MKKVILVLGVMLGVLVLVGGCLWFFVLRERVVLEGWIDCMPPLTEHEQRLCDEAERQNYPYVSH